MPRKRKLPHGLWLRGDTYYARFSNEGRIIRKRLSTDFRAACEMLNELRARADRADFDLLDNDCDLSDIRKQWLRYCKQTLRPGTVKRYRENSTAILEGMNARKVTHLTVDRVTTYRQDRLFSEVNPAARTVNMEVGALSMMLNWAVDHKLIGSNPLAGVKPLPTEDKRKDRRALTAAEVESLFEKSPKRLKPVWRLFVTTGIRECELVDLRFDDIDWDRQTMTVRAGVAKSKREREIPLDDETMGMLIGLREEAADREPVLGWTPKQTQQQLENFSRDHVFITEANTPYKNNLLRTFYRICKLAGIDGAQSNGSVDIHSLRVTFATLSLENGANPKAVQGILGHATLAMTMSVYAKATERSKRAAISALPFAQSSAPEYVLSIANSKSAESAQESAQVFSRAVN